ncbi:MAG: Flp pilus assembly complex ATPase component TadA, partial [Phycisphaerae bacterium]|nr:Flp pilus assembly complex ATPase component TadA [Phycisphaerae bacterium]
MIPDSIGKLIKLAKAQKATDIHICAGAPILFRVGRDLIPSTQRNVTPELSKQMAFEMLTPAQVEQFQQQLDYDLMIADDEGRYRVNISQNDGFVGVVIRILPEQAKSLDELRVPPAVKKLATNTKGLILITGSTSQGKSSTMSGIIDEINTHRRKNIVTIEDPIETAHVNKKSIVRQREVGRDTKSFHTGLRAALRQDPDVILVGEMRDLETTSAAITAAETGHLVLSTLHTQSAAQTIERIIDIYPAAQQNQIRTM